MFFSQIRHLCKHFFFYFIVHLSFSILYTAIQETQVHYIMLLLLLLHTVQFSHCIYLHSYNKYDHVHPFVGHQKQRLPSKTLAMIQKLNKQLNVDCTLQYRRTIVFKSCIHFVYLPVGNLYTNYKV